MRFNFDLLLEKNYPGGGKKVVSFCRILEDPSILGSLEGVTGRVSTVKNGDFQGYSLMSLVNNCQINLPSIPTEKGHVYPTALRFHFSDPGDAKSIDAVLVGENGAMLAVQRTAKSTSFYFSLSLTSTLVVSNDEVYLATDNL